MGHVDGGGGHEQWGRAIIMFYEKMKRAHLDTGVRKPLVKTSFFFFKDFSVSLSSQQ
jgi:hypothetical protein